MNILLDHCVHRKFASLLPGHSVKTAGQMKWQGLQNGKLLAAAASHFDVMITVDRGIQYQQNPATLPLTIIILEAYSNSIFDLAPLAPSVLTALESLAPRTLVKISGKKPPSP